MNRLEYAFLMAQTDGAEPRLSVRTQTRVDAGRWWRRNRLWVCVTDSDLVVLAVARRRYVQRVSIANCQSSHYCNTTGELVIDDGEELRFNRLAMSPAEGLNVLRTLAQTQHEHV